MNLRKRINKLINYAIIAVSLFIPLASFGQIKQYNLDTLVTNLSKKLIEHKDSTGVSIGVYNNGISYCYNYGTIERGITKPPSQNTVYEIGSLTKAFISIVLANAVIEKRVNLNDDVCKYLNGVYPNLEYKETPVTLLDLSNTTSTLPDWLPAMTHQITSAPGDSIPFLIEKVYAKYSEEDFLSALHDVEIDTFPGVKAAHSNSAAYLLSYILEKVYKTSMENLVNKYILAPAKMNNTSFFASQAASNLLAKGYNETGKLMPYIAATFFKGIGGLNSTTSDLLNFIKFQLDTTNEAVNLSHQKTLDTEWGNIGLTWRIYKWENGIHQIWATGGTYGFTSLVVFYPEINSGVVILHNKSDASSSSRLSDIANKIFKFIYNK